VADGYTRLTETEITLPLAYHIKEPENILTIEHEDEFSKLLKKHIHPSIVDMKRIADASKIKLQQ
jgi:phospholipid N-methyltransferase